MGSFWCLKNIRDVRLKKHEAEKCKAACKSCKELPQLRAERVAARWEVLHKGH